MRRILLIFLIIYLGHPAFGQQEETKVLFSEALAVHLPKYEKKSKKAYRQRDFEEGQRLFDSLVNFGLKGTFMDDFKFRKLNGKETAISKFNKPVYLITYASWCVTSKGEIPALNQLAKKYRNEVKFVVLFWDDKKTARNSSRPYNEFIDIVYVDELSNQSSYVVSQLKHALGLPTIFLLDTDKKILDIRRGVTHSYTLDKKRSFDLNYDVIKDGITNHLLPEENFNEDPVAVF